MEPSALRLPVWGLFIGLIVAFLEVAHSIFIPIFFAIFAAFILSPIVHFLHRWHLPRTISSALIIVLFTVGIGALFNYLSEPISVWMERLPTELKHVEKKLIVVRHSIQNVQETTEKIDAISSSVGVPTARNKVVTVKPPSVLNRLLNNTQSFLVSLISTVVLIYLLLAFGEDLANTARNVWRNTGYQEIFVRIAQDARRKVSHYLLLITVINIGLGVCVSLVMWVTGMPNPVIWGISATILNYIPYIGPAINLAIVLAVSLLTFNNLGAVLLPPSLLLLLNIIEGQFIQPIFAGKMFIINPILIFVSVLFWGWLWGVAGVFLAVPILMVLKIAVDHTRLHRTQLRGEAALTADE
ncbi:AI-2E family transporter [Halothiobacillus diazotrophicus]|uniref:AI-2E family transporter n=1 Tax=Halothiobacillus diazotrophicus TaxID=1860122 RepID=UPI0009EDB343|nr:AI-2E family transporter [Halothiobacillus diazotrophicus]